MIKKSIIRADKIKVKSLKERSMWVKFQFVSEFCLKLTRNEVDRFVLRIDCSGK